MAINEVRWAAVEAAFAAPERPDPAVRCMRCRRVIAVQQLGALVRWETDPELMARFLAVHKQTKSSSAGMQGSDPTDYPFLLCPECRA